MSLLTGLWLWARNLPQTARLVGLGVILAAGGIFWAFQHGKSVGRAEERIAADQRATEIAMNNLVTARKETNAAAQTVANRLPALHAADAAARPIDSRRVEIRVPGVQKTDTVLVPVQVVTRMVADSMAIADRDTLILKLRVQTARADSVIDSQATELADMKAAPGSAKPTVVQDAAFGAVLGGAAGAIAAHGIIGAALGGPVGLVGGILLHFVLRR